MLRKTSYLWILSYNIMKNKVPLYPRFTKLRKTGYHWTLGYNVVKNYPSLFLQKKLGGNSEVSVR